MVISNQIIRCSLTRKLNFKGFMNRVNTKILPKASSKQNIADTFSWVNKGADDVEDVEPDIVA